MPNLVIDIGNTALKAAWSDGTTLGKTFRYQGERTVDFILSLTSKVKPDIIVISTVRDISARDMDILEKECSLLLVLSGKHTDIITCMDYPRQGCIHDSGEVSLQGTSMYGIRHGNHHDDRFS